MTTQTKVYAKLLYIDFRTATLIGENEAGFCTNEYLKKALEEHRKKVKDIERDYKLFPNNRFYVLKLKKRLSEDIKRVII